MSSEQILNEDFNRLLSTEGIGGKKDAFTELSPQEKEQLTWLKNGFQSMLMQEYGFINNSSDTVGNLNHSMDFLSKYTVPIRELFNSYQSRLLVNINNLDAVQSILEEMKQEFLKKNIIKQ